MELTEEEVNNQIIRVIELYSQLMTRNTGRRYMGWNPSNPGACKCWDHFARAAEAVRRSKADPEEYLAAQFVHGTPFPNQLYGEEAGRNYRKTAHFDARRFEDGKATRKLTVEDVHLDAFIQSARLVLSYIRAGMPKYEVYEVAGRKLSAHFILADPDEVTRMMEREPPQESWLRGAWIELRENPMLRKKLTALWRQVWNCERPKFCPGPRPTPSSP